MIAVNLKKLARKIIPPIVLDTRIAILNRIRISKTVGERPFRNWWNSQNNSSKIPHELKDMTDYFCATRESRLMSKYWWFLAKRNIEQIENDGYENFKQTVARNYYTWVGQDGEILMSEVLNNLKDIGVGGAACSLIPTKYSDCTLISLFKSRLILTLIQFSFTNTSRRLTEKMSRFLKSPPWAIPRRFQLITNGSRRTSSTLSWITRAYLNAAILL